MDHLKPQIEKALIAKLGEFSQAFSGKPMQRLDIGVFPWDGAIELSILLAEDQSNPKDIAAWPHYNASAIYEGKWPEAESVCKEMKRMWEAKAASSIRFFQLVGDVVKSPAVAEIINSFIRSPSFEVTLFDPDRKASGNYCA